MNGEEGGSLSSAVNVSRPGKDYCVTETELGRGEGKRQWRGGGLAFFNCREMKCIDYCVTH